MSSGPDALAWLTSIMACPYSPLFHLWPPLVFSPARIE